MIISQSKSRVFNLKTNSNCKDKSLFSKCIPNVAAVQLIVFKTWIMVLTVSNRVDQCKFIYQYLYIYGTLMSLRNGGVYHIKEDINIRVHWVRLNYTRSVPRWFWDLKKTHITQLKDEWSLWGSMDMLAIK